jgi:hypothetical protein
MKKRFIPSIFSKVSTFIALFGVLCLFAIPVYATDGPMWETTDKMLSDKYKGKSYSPYAKRDFPNGLYWGDSHLHTGRSPSNFPDPLIGWPSPTTLTTWVLSRT